MVCRKGTQRLTHGTHLHLNFMRIVLTCKSVSIFVVQHDIQVLTAANPKCYMNVLKYMCHICIGYISDSTGTTTFHGTQGEYSYWNQESAA